MLKKWGLLSIIMLMFSCSWGIPTRAASATLTPNMLPFLSTSNTHQIKTTAFGALYSTEKTFKFAHYRLGLSEVISLNLITEKPSLIGDILPYPNPAVNNNIFLAYMLTGPMDLDVRFYSLLGREVKRDSIAKNNMGGYQGYNKWPLKLISNSGTELSNGIYYILVFNKETHQLLGRTKLAISR